MKYLSIILLVFLLGACEDDCMESSDPVCNEQVPTDELCQAAFSRWFYDSNTETCSEIAYSGCEAYGFESQEACEACSCE